MRKLWTFGCSFTHGDGCFEYDEYYKKYKKTDDDLTWNMRLAKEFNMELANKGYGGISNDKIMDKIISCWDDIQENDIVIISKTFNHRFDFPTREESNEFTTLVYNPGKSNRDKWFESATRYLYTKSQIEAIKSFSLEFSDHQAYSKRVDLRFEFIKTRLLKDKLVKQCIIWDVGSIWDSFETIVQATNGEIQDSHWSYKGHEDFSNYIKSIM